jgi:hypothetical protein
VILPLTIQRIGGVSIAVSIFDSRFHQQGHVWFIKVSGKPQFQIVPLSLMFLSSNIVGVGYFSGHIQKWTGCEGYFSVAVYDGGDALHQLNLYCSGEKKIKMEIDYKAHLDNLDISEGPMLRFGSE